MPRRYIFTLIIIAIVFIGGIALLTSLISSNKNPDTTSEKPETLQNTKVFTEDARNVTFTTYGPVVGDNQRRAIRISINAQGRVVEVLSGYQEHVTKDKYEYNTQEAYDDFLIALESAGFNLYQPEYDIDPRSQCVQGNRYSYGIEYLEFDDIYTWSTSCSNKQGNFRGNRALVESLMQNQITDYSEFVSGVNL